MRHIDLSIEALIFDVDGTLADTEEAHRQAFNDAFRAYELVLPCLADSNRPLGAGDAWRVGAPYLGLAQLATFHAATFPRVAHFSRTFI